MLNSGKVSTKWQVITGVYIIQNYNIDEITYITRKKTLKILCIRKVFLENLDMFIKFLMVY